MNQKSFSIIFLIVLGIAVAVVVISRLSEGVNRSSASPTPVPRIDSLFQQRVESSAQVSLATASPQVRQTKQYPHFPGIYLPEQLKNKKIVISTAKGNIEFEIYPEATKAASNFIYLAQDKFYNGLTFHRVEPFFVIQGGDPKRDGSGGPGYVFEDEMVKRAYSKGIVAMANAGSNTNGSQFFIMLSDHPELPPKYTIFGKVIAGLDVVDKIQAGDVMQSVSVANLK